jgi:hypothetical protein
LQVAVVAVMVTAAAAVAALEDFVQQLQLQAAAVP